MSKSCFSSRDRCNFDSFDHWKCFGLLAVHTQTPIFTDMKETYLHFDV